MPKAAVIQMTSSPEVQANLDVARRLLESARAQGAVLAALPENFAIMGRTEQEKLAVSESEGDGPIQNFLASTARELGLWIVGGTIPVRSERVTGKVAAAELVYDASGTQVARYDKIHLFDVDLPGREERYRESATIAAGERPVVVDTPIGRLGLAVCYDLRFPELFRGLLAQTAQVFCLPSAFTAPTGLAHWDVLIRARAIENLCYMLAPAQWGRHANGRETYGDSMIVHPWGEVLDRRRDGVGLAIADIDLSLQSELRERFPCVSHRRLSLGAP
jgi:deaminated glutathione amidase